MGQQYPQNPLGRSLAPGEVLGRRLRACKVAGFVLTEACFPTGAALPVHSHVNGFFRLIVSGVSTDVAGGMGFLGQAASVVYHPAAENHANVWHQKGSSFVIELPMYVTDRVAEEPARWLERRQTFGSGPVVQAAHRVFREFRQMDCLSPLALESLILELLVVACRTTAPAAEQAPPGWLRRAKEMLDECPTQPHVLADVAGASGVHPGHFARAFRLHYRCTAGEYLRQRRVERAIRLLRGNTPLAEIATAAGFADQSHFSAVFKRHTGMTPAVYRKIAR